VDQVMEISQSEAEETMRSLARVEGERKNSVSTGGATSAALRLSTPLGTSMPKRRSLP